MAWEKPLAETIAALWDTMPDDQRAERAVYDKRLRICKGCAHLINGTCLKCGCFVEMRAMRAWQRCPDVPAKWESVG